MLLQPQAPPDDAAALRDAGLRVTRPRLAVLEALRAGPHSGADAVRARVATTLGQVSHQAVYDVLNILTAPGSSAASSPPAHVSLYELRVGDNHHHLVCRGCGTVSGRRLRHRQRALPRARTTSTAPPRASSSTRPRSPSGACATPAPPRPDPPPTSSAPAAPAGPHDPSDQHHRNEHHLRQHLRHTVRTSTDIRPHRRKHGRHRRPTAAPRPGTGAPAPSDRNSLTLGDTGPILLHDHHYIEQMAHFNRERVPERNVHAKGSGAFGVFETTEDVSAVHQGRAVPARRAAPRCWRASRPSPASRAAPTPGATRAASR